MCWSFRVFNLYFSCKKLNDRCLCYVMAALLVTLEWYLGKTFLRITPQWKTAYTLDAARLFICIIHLIYSMAWQLKPEINLRDNLLTKGTISESSTTLTSVIIRLFWFVCWLSGTYPVSKRSVREITAIFSGHSQSDWSFYQVYLFKYFRSLATATWSRPEVHLTTSRGIEWVVENNLLFCASLAAKHRCKLLRTTILLKLFNYSKVLVDGHCEKLSRSLLNQSGRSHAGKCRCNYRKFFKLLNDNHRCFQIPLIFQPQKIQKPGENDGFT